MKSLIKKIGLILILFSSCFCFAQENFNLKNLITTSNQQIQNNAAEKIYIHTDKPNYQANDTLWFKAYILDAGYYLPSLKSGILYIELANDSNFLIKRWMLPVVKGITYGNIFLSDKEYKKGTYVLRAYTNWMRNFNEDVVFQKLFNINNYNNKEWLINYNVKDDDVENNYRITLNAKKYNGSGLILSELELNLFDYQKKIYKEKLKTDIEGNLSTVLKIPDNVEKKSLALSIRNLQKGEENRIYNFPIMLNSSKDIDIQFMPESGNIIDGIKSKVAFKALNSLGMGININAELFEEGNSEKILDFESAYNGMGYFYFTPSLGKNYYAKLKQASGNLDQKRYPLPIVKNEGIVLTVINHQEADSVQIKIRHKLILNNEYYFLAKARDIICFAFKLNIKQDQLDFNLHKSLFPSGVVSLLIVNKNKETINQRLVYIDHQDDLNIKLSSDKESYHQRDSVKLTLSVSDKNGLPVFGNFSLAVTDDLWVKQDSLTYNSISTYLNLSSYLRGNIENVGYYKNAIKDKKKWQNLDNLLLTQGWTNYFPISAFETERKMKYEVEEQFIIKGKATNAFNKPIDGAGITLLSKKPFMISESKTDSLGKFYFKDIFPLDTALFFIQAKNKRDKSFNVGIEIDEFLDPNFKKLESIPQTPWNVNIDNNLQLNINEQLNLANQKDLKLNGNLLKEVIVVAKKVVRDSKNINGPGEADLILDEEAIKKENKITLGELIRKKIPGVYIKNNSYRINSQGLHIIIDGVDIEFFKPETGSLSNYFDEYLNYYTAEDIIGLELMKTGNYALSYVNEYLGPLTLDPFDHAFIEITTRGGVGPFLKRSVGTYLYKPLAFSIPKQFYSPKYTTKGIVDMTDVRSTIFWNPNFTTDKAGKARISFFTSDNTGTYSIYIEGSDMSGYFVSQQSKINIEKAK